MRSDQGTGVRHRCRDHDGITTFDVEHGYADILSLYLAGRCGVPGDVDADVVSAAFGFLHPGRLREVVRPARQASELYAEALGRQAAAAWQDLPGKERLAELAERVVIRHHQRGCRCSPAGGPRPARWKAAAP